MTRPEWCISRRTGLATPVPHRHRLVAAGVVAEPPAPVQPIEEAS